jgi:hypothetical protein
MRADTPTVWGVYQSLDHPRVSNVCSAKLQAVDVVTIDVTNLA